MTDYKNMRKLSDHFSKWTCAQFAGRYKITTVEDALQLSDADILKLRGVGLMFIHRLRNLGPVPPLTQGQQDVIQKAFDKLTAQCLAAHGIYSKQGLVTVSTAVNEIVDLINAERAKK